MTDRGIEVRFPARTRLFFLLTSFRFFFFSCNRVPTTAAHKEHIPAPLLLKFVLSQVCLISFIYNITV
jgi:hypothetical protein